MHLIMAEFDCPEVTVCSLQDIKTQSLTCLDAALCVKMPPVNLFADNQNRGEKTVLGE